MRHARTHDRPADHVDHWRSDTRAAAVVLAITIGTYLGIAAWLWHTTS